MQNYASSKNPNLFRLSLTVAIVVVVVLGIANLIATNLIATEGARLNSISQETSNLVKDNHILETRLSELKSLTYLEERAKELGFVPASNIASINTPDSVAQVLDR